MDTKNTNFQADDQKVKAGCNVSQTFNFTVGAIAIAVAVIIGYIVYKYVIK